MAFDFDSLKHLLCCPTTRAPLVQDGDRLVSTDPETRYVYPIEHDIPKLLPSDATQLAEDEWRAIIEKHSGSQASDSSD